jgi:hypothetical protein
MCDNGETTYKDFDPAAKPLSIIYQQRGLQAFKGKGAPARPGAMFTVSVVICRHGNGKIGASFRCYCANSDKAFEELFFMSYDRMEQSAIDAVWNALDGRNNKEDTQSWLRHVAEFQPAGTLTKTASKALLLRIVKAFLDNAANKALIGAVTIEGLEAEMVPHVGHIVRLTIPGELVQADPKVQGSLAYISPGRNVAFVSSVATAHPLVEASSCAHQLSAAQHILGLAKDTVLFNVLLEPGAGGFSEGLLRRTWNKFDAEARGEFTYAVEAAEKLKAQKAHVKARTAEADERALLKANQVAKKGADKAAGIAMRVQNRKT